MPPKRPPAPIDRPLSKAYLRQFSGWSTAYPPGMSEPNSLRVMENVMITREGSARVRPGLRSYMRTRMPYPIVGSHELFYTEQGKAYLVAVRTETAVEFRIISELVVDGTLTPTLQTLQQAGFDEIGDAGSVSFSLATTYVRYLQIDNKIFALPNAPEPMLMFWVGAEKKARRLSSIERPAWTVEDKPIVVHPDAGWVLTSIPTDTRTNLVKNPSFASTRLWSASSVTDFTRDDTTAYIGSWAARLASAPEKTNLVSYPLNDPARTGTTGWKTGVRIQPLTVVSNSMKITFESGKSSDDYCYTNSYFINVTPGMRLRIGADLVASANLRRWQTGVYFYRSTGEQIGGRELTGGNANFDPRRVYSTEIVVPDQAAKMRVLLGGYPSSTSKTGSVQFKNVSLTDVSEGASSLNGDMGADYYWTGTPDASQSVLHPAQTVEVVQEKVSSGPGDYIASAHVKSTVARTVNVVARALNSSGSVIASQTGTSTTVPNFWTRFDSGVLTAPAETTHVQTVVQIVDVPRGEEHFVDAVMLEKAAVLGGYFSGDSAPDGSTVHSWAGTPHESLSYAKTYDPSGTTVPPDEDETADTLISSDGAANLYSFGFYYTIGNEIGESAESQITVVRTQRPWTSWLWQLPNGAGEPSGTNTADPRLSCDQLVAYMPQDVFDAAIAAGATHWNAYFFTWGPNDVRPVTAIKYADIPLSPQSTYGSDSHAVLTPQQIAIGATDPVVPTEETRFNSTDPQRGSQGLVAADRLILVGAPNDPARITWSSGAPGAYYDFSPAKGGGTKQLTSGNLYLTATVKLWQNPQSVDTLTVLTMGDDGRSNVYYMQPATITSLSETINVMGFEEVSSMMGTSSPYGCEVLNNALYHPLEQFILKSTANNYNLSHRTVTDMIENVWQALQTHRRIVSSQLDNRIYYLVHNRLGAPLQENCNGNEVWVMDLAAKEPTWSRWLVQGQSLRAMEIGNVVMMSLVHPDGIFCFAPERANDEVFDPDTGDLGYANIPWYMETNTQGANRAHDAWCNLQQANVMVGNFEGQLRYGIRGKDVHGMDIDIGKQLLATVPPADGVPDEELDTIGERLTTLIPTDREDYLLIRKLMKEWFFYAGSINDEVQNPSPGDGDDDLVQVPRFSAGQISLVQYRYTPATVNVGYEYGSVETFEYGSSDQVGTTTDSGVPKPYVDLSMP